MDPVPVNSQKHDIAWKHCQMFKNGDRVELKCIYCGKMFRGGGIHRIKEHLAGFRGNASTCLRVPPDVRLIMQESLDGVVMKKRKKQKLAEEVSTLNPNATDLDTYNNPCGLNTEVDLLPVPDTQLNSNLSLLVNREEGTSRRGRKKGKIRKGSALANHNVVPVRVSNPLHVAIGRFFFDVGVPLDAVNSIYFQPMIDAILFQGAGAVVPTPHDLRTAVLKSSVEEVRNDIDQRMGTWSKTGCSLLVDEWVLEKGKTLIGFLVYCPERTIFLRSVDITDIINSTDALYELIKEVVEEVGVRNVLQVVTNSEDRYVVVGKRLTNTFPTIFWTPCAARCIDLMLEDIRKLDRINKVFEQAKSIARFIYNHSVVLNMMRRFTFGVDLVELGVTHLAADFTTLKRMVNIKHNLHSMVTSDEWMESPYSKKPEGLTMLDHITSQSFWSTCTLITRLTDPLLRLLRLVGSEKRPGMGYVYAGMYRAKETIKKELVHRKDYQIYWNIIDQRWEQLHRHPLHAAGFYLNPKFFYSTEGDIHLHIRSLVYDCVEKLVPDAKTQDKIVKETTSYHNVVGDFGRKMAIRARDTLLPGEDPFIKCVLAFFNTLCSPN